MNNNFINEIKNKKIFKIVNALNQILSGKENQIILTLIGFFSDGHILIEDLPGVGKTTLALAVSKILGLKFGRIQCTPDLLPSDITGINIYDKTSQKFIFKKGPIFNNVVLIDEINRATQKTQSALLEVMEEKQVTVDGETYHLDEPFFVIATQNPVEFAGTFPLPTSQLDRFILSFSIGYPSFTEEMEILKNGSLKDKIDYINPVFEKHELNELKNSKDKVYVSDKIVKYIIEIANRTRNSEYLQYGISPRASISLMECAKTLSFFSGRDYVTYSDVKSLSEYVLPHRLILKEEYSSINKREIARKIVNEIPVNL